MLKKAYDLAQWLTFKNRTRNERFVVVHGPDDDFVVMPLTDAFEHEFSIITHTFSDYSAMDYGDIESIRIDENPLEFWEDLTGAFAIMDGEVLRYILETNIPLEKLVRYELAIRGYDQNHKWVGFEKAKEIWLP